MKIIKTIKSFSVLAILFVFLTMSLTSTLIALIDLARPAHAVAQATINGYRPDQETVLVENGSGGYDMYKLANIKCLTGDGQRVFIWSADLDKYWNSSDHGEEGKFEDDDETRFLQNLGVTGNWELSAGATQADIYIRQGKDACDGRKWDTSKSPIRVNINSAPRPNKGFFKTDSIIQLGNLGREDYELHFGIYNGIGVDTTKYFEGNVYQRQGDPLTLPIGSDGNAFDKIAGPAIFGSALFDWLQGGGASKQEFTACPYGSHTYAISDLKRQGKIDDKGLAVYKGHLFDFFQTQAEWNKTDHCTDFDYSDVTIECNTKDFTCDVKSDSPTVADEESKCESFFASPMGWFFCAMTHAAIDAVNVIVALLSNLLVVNIDDLFSEKSHEAWINFRNIGLSLLVVFALIMIISQAMSLSIFDAYSIKKILPRLIFAAIFIILSWSLLKLMVDVINDLGLSVRSIILTPFGQPDWPGLTSDITKNLGSQVGAGAATAGIVLLSPFIVLGFLVFAIVAGIVAFFVLAFRQVLILFLAIIAPIAIVLFILPNTEKYFKFWWDNWLKILFMYPMIMGLFAMGQAFAVVSINKGGITGVLIALVAIFTPLFLILKVFSWTGGAMGAIGKGLAKGQAKLAASGKKGIAKGREGLANYSAGKYQMGAKGFKGRAGNLAVRVGAGKYGRGVTIGAAGAQYEEARNKEAEASLTRTVASMNYDKSQKFIRDQSKLGGHMATAATSKMIERGDFEGLTQYRDNAKRSDWNGVVSRNFSAINAARPDLAQGGMENALQKASDASMKDWHGSMWQEAEKYYAQNGPSSGVQTAGAVNFKQQGLRLLASQEFGGGPKAVEGQELLTRRFGEEYQAIRQRQGGGGRPR